MIAAFLIVAALVLYLGYNAQEPENSQPAIKTEVEKSPKEEKKQEKVKPVEKKEAIKNTQENKTTASRPEQKIEEYKETEKTVLIDDDEYEEDEQDEKEDARAPVVSRDKLIGGADVEWTEPKERPADSIFGLPPE